MDQNLVYSKTPIGDEAVRQSTRVVQRNLRMLLVQVDGKLSVAELGAKLGDPGMVEHALRELEEGGYIVPALEAVSLWQESKLRIDRLKAAAASGASALNSTLITSDSHSASSNFSSFGKPVFPVGAHLSTPEVSGLEQRGLTPKRSRLVLTLSGLSGLVLLVVSVVMLFPYTRFKPEIEAELARIWQAPVSVGDVRFNLLPQPLLLLADVRIGRGGESAIDKMRILEPYFLLGSGRSSLPRVEIDGGKIAIGHLMALSAPDGRPERNVSKANPKSVAFDRLSIGSGELVFGELVGEASFGNSGQIKKVSLQTVDRSLRIEAQASPEGMILDVEGVGWRPTEASALTF
ncbi:MAG: hypothetical protein WCA83_05635, partial [Azonexus sp.]